MVPLIKGDRGLQPAEEGGDGRLGGARLPVAYLMLTFSPNDVGPSEDHDALLGLGETVAVLACHASFLGYRLFVVSFFQPIGLS